MPQLQRYFALVACAACLVPLAACAPTRTGIRIGDETLEQFKAGQTTEEWLLAILGPPTSISVVEGVEDTEVFRYRLTESKTGLLTLFTGGGEQTVSVVYFILTRGIVTRFWADRETSQSLLGQVTPTVQGQKLLSP